MDKTRDKLIATTGILSGICLGVILMGDRLPRLWAILIIGVSFQTIVGLGFQLGLVRSFAAQSYRWIYGFCSLISTLILVSLIFADQSLHGSDSLLMGMEPATAILVIGITLWPFTFVALWTFAFNRAILPKESIREIKDAEQLH